MRYVMRTTLDLPEDLLNEAMQVKNIRTKTKVPAVALEELVKKSKFLLIIVPNRDRVTGSRGEREYRLDKRVKGMENAGVFSSTTGKNGLTFFFYNVPQED